MERFDALLQRKSTRHYAPEPVSADIFDQIRTEIKSIQLPFYDAGDLNIELIEDGTKIQRASKGLIGAIAKSRAPHYLVLSGKPEDGMLENAGFAGENLILSLTAQGIATCWQGGHVKKSARSTLIDTNAGHHLAALIGFGRPKQSGAHLRNDPARANRKRVDQLTADGVVDSRWRPIIEAVRLAPSAVNSQPWRFYCDGKRLHLFIAPAGSFLFRKMLGDINLVDAGIALCHIAEAARHLKRSISYESTPDVRYGELTYILTVVDTDT
ncbi:MAG: nitroreductase family protein [Chitinivibrionales bacterium]